MDGESFALAQTLWDLLNLDGPLEPMACIVGLGSDDLQVADRCAERAIPTGVPATRSKLEAKSTDIGEDILFTKALLNAEGEGLTSVAFVTKPAPERRVLATGRRLWPETNIFITSPKISCREQYEQGMRENWIHEMAGDLQPMTVDPNLGFQVPQEIPSAVSSAYERLIRLGDDQPFIRQWNPWKRHYGTVY